MLFVQVAARRNEHLHSLLREKADLEVKLHEAHLALARAMEDRDAVRARCPPEVASRVRPAEGART